MDLSVVIKDVFSRISQFSSLSPECEIAQSYYQKTVEILDLLKAVLEEVIASEISPTEKIGNLLEELDGLIKYCTDIMDHWHLLSSKLYFVLHIECALTKIRLSTLEMFLFISPAFEALEEKSHSACVESCLDKLQGLSDEPVSDIIKEAVNGQIEKASFDSELIVKVSRALSLLSNEELLMEIAALVKLKTLLNQVETPEELECIDTLISLVNGIHDSYVRENQLPGINGVQIPTDFCCPLSLELMSDPVIVASGQTYERAFIRRWLDAGLTVCPKTHQPLSHANLIPNYTVKALIANWCDSNNINLPDPVQSVARRPLSPIHTTSDINADDTFIPKFGHLKELLSGSTAKSTDGNIKNGLDSAMGRLSLEVSGGTSTQGQVCSSPSCQFTGQMDTECSNENEDGASTESAPVSSSSQRENESQPSSGQSELQPRGQNQATWRRPSDRLVPRIVSSPAVDSRSNVSEVEAQVQTLIDDLKSDSIELQRNATHELRLLAKHNNENRIVIANCGAIPHLVYLLGSEDPKTQENAVTALLNLSLSDNNKIAIANADAIDPLIRVLETGNPEAKENSAATLFSLSVIEENKAKIGRSGAIRPLVILLGEGTPRGKKDAATALFNLSIFHENKARIVQAGAVKHLVELMDPAAGMVDKAVAVLANLATIPEGRTAIGQEGGILALVEVIELGSARGKENAAAALLHLCTNSSRFCTMVLQEGAVPPLVALSQSGTSRAREKAQLLLTHFRNQRHGGGRT